MPAYLDDSTSQYLESRDNPGQTLQTTHTTYSLEAECLVTPKVAHWSVRTSPPHTGYYCGGYASPSPYC